MAKLLKNRFGPEIPGALPHHDEPWIDEKLYKKYGLAKDEVAFIESMIRPMEGKNE